MATTENVHPEEINKFGSLAERWWDPKGEFNTLHAVNPLRTAFIQKYTAIKDQHILDVGCGGGILSEALAKLDGRVVGIDLSKDLIEIADLHSLESKLKSTTRKLVRKHWPNTARNPSTASLAWKCLSTYPNPRPSLTPARAW